MLCAAGMAAGFASAVGTTASFASTANGVATVNKAAAGPKFLACEVTDTGGINDRSFNASAYQGLKAAEAVDPKIVPKVPLVDVDERLHA